MAPRRIWAGEIGQKLVLAVNAWLTTQGLAHSDETVTKAIKALRTGPPWNKWSQETLWRKYWVARRHHGNSPPPTEEDRWASTLQKWGMSPEKARELVDRLIAITTTAHKRADLGQLFDYLGRRRMYSRPRRVEWLRRQADRIQADRHYWPIRAGRELPDTNASLVLAMLCVAPRNRATVPEIADATGIKLRTCQDLLVSMNASKDIVRVADGEYALPAQGIIPYVPPSIAILTALKDGLATPAELRARTGKSADQIAGALHWLWKHKKIVRTDYGLWALPGTAPPHIIARDAILEALQSGAKTVRELMAATGKNRGEIWQALRGLKAKCLVIEAYLVHPGRRGYQAAFALPPERKTLRRAA
jgi:hypothetical protein